MGAIEIRLIGKNYSTDFIIDEEDHKLIEPYTWRVLKANGPHTDYIRGRKGSGKTVLLHRLILGITNPKIMVDHINGNGLDNRRCNLRVADYTTNNANAKVRKDSTTGVRGVHKLDSGKYVARIQYKKKRIIIGYYDNLEDAIIARQLKYIEIHGRNER